MSVDKKSSSSEYVWKLAWSSEEGGLGSCTPMSWLSINYIGKLDDPNASKPSTWDLFEPYNYIYISQLRVHVDMLTIKMTPTLQNSIFFTQKSNPWPMGFFLSALEIPYGQRVKHYQRSFEPRKNPPTFHYTGWLIGILIMVYYNPYMTG